MAHGYEELVTPLHLLMVYNAVANNGKMMKPYLVNSINEMGVEIKSFKPKVLVDKICSDETLGKLKDCLLQLLKVHMVRAMRLKVIYIEFAGKTGTAVTAMDNRGYNKGNKIYQSAFMGYFPADNPKYSIAVVIQNSSESKLVYGGCRFRRRYLKKLRIKFMLPELADKPFNAQSISRIIMLYTVLWNEK